MHSPKNKIRGIVTKDMERVGGLNDFSAYGFALVPGLCWIPNFGQPLSCQASLQLSQTSQLGVPTHSLLTQIPLEIPETAGSTSARSRECKNPQLWLALVVPANLISQWATKEKSPSWTRCSYGYPNHPAGKNTYRSAEQEGILLPFPSQAPVTGCNHILWSESRRELRRLFTAVPLTSS